METKFVLDFKKKLKDFNLDTEYEFVKMNGTIVVLKHKCGNLLSLRENEFFYENKRCFFCELSEKTNNEFKAINFEIKNNNSIFTIQHTCGHCFQTTRTKFYRQGIRCPKCSRRKKFTIETFSKEVEDITNGEYLVISKKYKGISEKLDILHVSCGNIMEISSAHFLNDGRRCRKCALNQRKNSIETIKQAINAYANNEIEILSQYADWKTEMEFKHTVCGNSFKRIPKDMIKNCRERNGAFCPCCNICSIGEKEILEILKENNITFLHNKRLKKSKSLLRFDFIIFEDDSKEKIKAFIEFDGPQHLEERAQFGGEEGLKDTQRRDTEKNLLAEKINIPLYRIQYKDKWNIESILKNLGII